MDIINDIKTLLSDSNAQVTTEWLDEACRQYPYFNLPLLLYLKRNGNDENDALMGRLAIASPDRKALSFILDSRTSYLASFYPPEAEPETPDTDTTIDKFLDSYGNSNPGEVEAINKAIFNPTPDYADILAAQEKEEKTPKPVEISKNDELINNFIAQSREKEAAVASTVEVPHIADAEKAEIADVSIDKPSAADDSMLSESLAKIYISKHKYSKALEIIKNISLKFPEKSIYFADQIRFLKKLELNEKLINKK
jgi:hypothetical protein